MHRSIAYNNAAVYLTEMGHYSVALDLLVCALQCRRFEASRERVTWAEAVLVQLFQYERLQVDPPYHNSDSATDPCGCCPFLYRAPFEIRETEAIDDCYATAILLFNAGLAHQRTNLACRKAAECYRGSSVLLPRVPNSQCLGLWVSLWNNLGVYCYECGLSESMRVCFDKVEDAIHTQDISTIKLALIEGVQENLEATRDAAVGDKLLKTK